MLSEAVGAALGAAKWVGEKVLMPALEKSIPQGAAELGNALFAGQAYTPYGATEQQMNKPEPEREEAPAVAPVQVNSREMER